MVISIRCALLTHGGWPFGETVRKETSVKNKLEKLIFHTAICAGAPQIALMAEEKSPSQISLRPVADAPEWRIV